MTKYFFRHTSTLAETVDVHDWKYFSSIKNSNMSFCCELLWESIRKNLEFKVFSSSKEMIVISYMECTFQKPTEKIDYHHFIINTVQKRL